jgi:hypothetical protein
MADKMMTRTDFLKLALCFCLSVHFQDVWYFQDFVQLQDWTRIRQLFLGEGESSLTGEKFKFIYFLQQIPGPNMNIGHS